MEDNPYSSMINMFRGDATDTRPVIWRIGTVLTENPLTVDINGAVQDESALVFTRPPYADYIDLEIDDTSLRYDDLNETIQHTLTVEPHTHTATVSSSVAATVSIDLATLAYQHTAIQPHNHTGVTEGHKHTGRVKNWMPKYEKGTSLLLLPIEDEQRYIVIARLYGV